MLSHVQGESRKTFSCPAGLNDTFLLLDPIFASMRVWFALFLVSDPIFTSIRVWFALFLFSDPGCSSLLALCQPFSILYGSDTRFFYSGTQFLLLYGSETFYFHPETWVDFPCYSGTSPFPSISPRFQFVSRFFTHFSTLLHTFFTFIRYLNHCQEEIPIDTISFS